MENTAAPTFQEELQNRLSRFQQEMTRYNLHVANTTNGTFRDETRITYNLYMCTEPILAKGNKQLIKQLKAAGYWVQKWNANPEGFPRRFMFRVCKVVQVDRPTTEAEAERVAACEK